MHFLAPPLRHRHTIAMEAERLLLAAERRELDDLRQRLARERVPLRDALELLRPQHLALAAREEQLTLCLKQLASVNHAADGGVLALLTPCPSPTPTPKGGRCRAAHLRRCALRPLAATGWHEFTAWPQLRCCAQACHRWARAAPW